MWSKTRCMYTFNSAFRNVNELSLRIINDDACARAPKYSRWKQNCDTCLSKYNGRVRVINNTREMKGWRGDRGNFLSTVLTCGKYTVCSACYSATVTRCVRARVLSYTCVLDTRRPTGKHARVPYTRVGYVPLSGSPSPLSKNPEPARWYTQDERKLPTLKGVKNLARGSDGVYTAA